MARRRALPRSPGERLRDLLYDARLSQRGASAKLGISSSSMTQYCNDHRPVPRMLWFALRWLEHEEIERRLAQAQADQNAPREAESGRRYPRHRGRARNFHGDPSPAPEPDAVQHGDHSLPSALPSDASD